MTDMLTRYNESTKPRVVQARQIPGLAVNFFDQQNEFQKEFATGERPGDPSKFTEKAEAYYGTEVRGIITPVNFQPTEQGVPLHRYTPDTPFYNPGAER